MNPRGGVITVDGMQMWIWENKSPFCSRLLELGKNYSSVVLVIFFYLCKTWEMIFILKSVFSLCLLCVSDLIMIQLCYLTHYVLSKLQLPNAHLDKHQSSSAILLYYLMKKLKLIRSPLTFKHFSHQFLKGLDLQVKIYQILMWLIKVLKFV